MTINIERELKRLHSLNLPELKGEFEKAWGEPARSNNRTYLVKRTVWRMQALAEGGLSERARRRAEAIARDEDLRVRPPPQVHEALRGLEGSPRRAELPPPGSVLSREYLGRRVEVKVLERGFVWDGNTYKSLTAVARAVTGSDWNGRLFFGLSGRGGLA